MLYVYTAWYFVLIIIVVFTLVHAVPNIIRGRGCMLAPNTKQHITCMCRISLEKYMPVVGGFTDYPKTSDLEVHKNRSYKLQRKWNGIIMSKICSGGLTFPKIHKNIVN